MLMIMLTFIKLQRCPININLTSGNNLINFLNSGEVNIISK